LVFAVLAAGIDRMMAVDDLPRRPAGAESRPQPGELRPRRGLVPRDGVGVEGEELHRTGREGVISPGQAPARAQPRPLDLGPWALPPLIIVIAQGGVDADPQRVVH